MATITLSSKNQITLPVEMVRALGLKGGDKLDVELISDRLVIWPKPQSYADYFIGSMKGYWGSKEDIDRYLEEVRYGGGTKDWQEEVTDLLLTDEGARKVVEWLGTQPGRRAQESQFMGVVAGALVEGGPFHKLVSLGVIRRLPREDREEYRLVRDALAPKWLQALEDYLAVDEDAWTMVGWLRTQPHGMSPEHRLYDVPGLNSRRAMEVLDKLVALGAVRRLPGPEKAYRLRRELLAA